MVDGCLIYGQAGLSRVQQTILIVSSSNFSYDYMIKLKLYAAAGVREYWIIDSTKEKIVQRCRKTPGFSYGDIRYVHRIYVSNGRWIKIYLY